MQNEILALVLRLATYLLMGVVCVAFFLFLMEIVKKTDDIGNFAKKGIDDAFKKRGTLYQYKRKMSKLGIMYRLGNYDTNPSLYIMARLAIGVLCALALYALSESIGISLLLGIPFGYAFTGVVFIRLNSDDNEEIMIDLYNTYANLKIQLEAGQHIVEAIEYSHGIAKNERYREALGELILNFSDKTVSMTEAIAIFQDRFDSEEIDKLCMMLQNFVMYGTQKEYTQDIMGEIQSILQADQLKAEHDIESKADAIRFAFFACVIFLTAYGSFTSFSQMGLFM